MMTDPRQRPQPQPLLHYIDEAVERVIDQICLESDITAEEINGNQRLRSFIRDEMIRVGVQARRPRS